MWSDCVTGNVRGYLREVFSSINFMAYNVVEAEPTIEHIYKSAKFCRDKQKLS